MPISRFVNSPTQYPKFLALGTVKGELSVAKFLDNYFSRVHFGTLVAVQPGPLVLQGTTDPQPILAYKAD
jgi:hypothetical protein